MANLLSLTAYGLLKQGCEFSQSDEKQAIYIKIYIAGGRAKKAGIGNAKEKREDRKMASRKEEERTGSNQKRR